MILNIKYVEEIDNEKYTINNFIKKSGKGGNPDKANKDKLVTKIELLLNPKKKRKKSTKQYTKK